VTSRISFVARARQLAVALLALLIVFSAPTAAVAASRPRDAASDADNRVAAAQRAANAEAGRYLAALSAFESLKTQATGIETAIAAGEQRANTLRRVVRERAARGYMRAGSSLPSLFTVDDLPDLMRSDKLLATANMKDGDALSLLSAQQADLSAKRDDLHRLEAQQGSALDSLQRMSRKADALLASALHDRSDVQARLAAQAAAAKATRSTVRSTSSRTTRSTRTAVPAVATVPPPPGSGSGSHHDDPFLSCVRQRESNGNYGVVNPAGPWYGAYQFLASTWNVAARHAGRIDLVGVIPSAAAPSDQDDIAWSLYQWQGAGPWGGGC
jgi:peptidoglycan hydrolase CwlO-like protein